ncbi:hypothetical protein AMJ80_12430 [bacterium SM23_31]|nr:MAG: hypothetical protein AMJ80_12430 [bacterium SM23_31]
MTSWCVLKNRKYSSSNQLETNKTLTDSCGLPRQLKKEYTPKYSTRAKTILLGTEILPLCPDCRRTLPVIRITSEQWQILQYKTGAPLKRM